MSSTSQDAGSKIASLALRAVTAARASHIASALSIIDILVVLYSAIMRYDQKNPNLASRDYFILSKGHACVALYATLANYGFFSEEEFLEGYGKPGSIFMHHASHKVPGVEFSTGSLGHGASLGAGIAFAKKAAGLDNKIYVLLSEGEMTEGSTWEAIQSAGHLGLANLVFILDRNRLQSLGDSDAVVRLDPIREKVESFRWDYCQTNGHDRDSLALILTSASCSDRPLFIEAETIKGYRVSFMENQFEWHYKSPSAEELQQALAELT